LEQRDVLFLEADVAPLREAGEGFGRAISKQNDDPFAQAVHAFSGLLFHTDTERQ
jgi:hypothetical protein